MKENRLGALERPPVRNEPPVGGLKASILMKIRQLGPDAFAYRVLEELMRDSGHWIDASQVYQSIYKMGKLAPTEERYVEEVGEREEHRGPKQKIYGLTAAGEAALAATIAYHRQQADYLAGLGTAPKRERMGGHGGDHEGEERAPRRGRDRLHRGRG